MNGLTELVQGQLIQADYSVALSEDAGVPFIMFENASILGFALCFPDAAALIERWHHTSQRVLRSAQFALRRAEAKSWNAYLVFIAEAPGDYGQNITLGWIRRIWSAPERSRARVSPMPRICMRPSCHFFPSRTLRS